MLLEPWQKLPHCRIPFDILALIVPQPTAGVLFPGPGALVLHILHGLYAEAVKQLP